MPQPPYTGDTSASPAAAPSVPIYSSQSATVLVLAATVGLALLLVWAAYSWPLDQRPIAKYPQDVVYLLVAAEAINDGQALHRDQLTPIGSLAFYPVALGQRLFGKTAAALNFLVASSAMSVLALALLVSWRRFSALSAVTLVAMSLLVVLLPVNLGEGHNALSIAMHYNKWGFALLGITFLASFWPISRSQWQLDAVILVVGLALLFYVKITYFIVAFVAAALALLLPLRDRHPRRALVATLSTLAAVLLITPLNWPYLWDIYQSGLASDSVGLGPFHILRLVQANYGAIFVVIASYALLFAMTPRANSVSYPVVLAGAIIVGGSFAALSQNAQNSGIPAVMALLVILFELTRRQVAATAQDGSRRRALLAAALILLLYPSAFALDAYLSLSKYQNAAGRFSHPEGAGGDDALSGLLLDPRRQEITDRWMSLPNAADVQRAVFLGDDIYGANPGAYFHSLLDARNLSGDQGDTTSRVWTADCVNGPAILDAFSPAPGWYLWTYESFAPLPAGPLFREVDSVMIPHFPAELRVRDRLLEAYGDDIASRFVRVQSSKYWTYCVKPGDPRAMLTAGPLPPCRLP